MDHNTRPTGNSVPPSVAPDAEVEHAYHVLGVDVGVSRAQLDAAYLSVIKRYSPEKLADAAGELLLLAVRRLAAATAARATILNAPDAPR